MSMHIKYTSILIAKIIKEEGEVLKDKNESQLKKKIRSIVRLRQLVTCWVHLFRDISLSNSSVRSIQQ